MTLPSAFFSHCDVVSIAKGLLGHTLFTEINDVRTGGIIVETEAYSHCNDLAMKKHRMRRPSSISTLDSNGGIAYIYTTYGHHSMLNIVTNREGYGDSVLIRAIKPTEGIETMTARRNKPHANKNLCSGPGKLTQALGVTPSLNGLDITCSDTLWIADNGIAISNEEIQCSPRIGIDYAEQDALLPWRFRLIS